jgi:hypothetical protein
MGGGIAESNWQRRGNYASGSAEARQAARERDEIVTGVQREANNVMMDEDDHDDGLGYAQVDYMSPVTLPYVRASTKETQLYQTKDMLDAVSYSKLSDFSCIHIAFTWKLMIIIFLIYSQFAGK